MKGWIAIALAMAGCDGATQLVRDSAPDAELHTTAPFTLLLCTGGNPGDPTCPVNIVDVTALGAGASLRMLAVPGSSRIFLHDIELSAGNAGLYVEDLRFVVHRDGEQRPSVGPFPPVIDLDAGETLTIDAAAVDGLEAVGAQLALQYGATR